MQVLNQAAKAAHLKVLDEAQDGQQRYSKFPVHEGEFWESLFALARNAETAQQVLNEIGQIENEPCIENDRVFRNVRYARHLARLALLN